MIKNGDQKSNLYLNIRPETGKKETSNDPELIDQ